MAALLIVDPQNDFCDPLGSLYVPGSDDDCDRLAGFITKNSRYIDSLHITLDQHDYCNIAHPIFWKDRDGVEPAPYTIITYENIISGTYVPYDDSLTDYAASYALQLQEKGKYRLMVWPVHCLIASWGSCIHSCVHESVLNWQRAQRTAADYVIKGKNPLTEHYSAVEAEVPVFADPDTQTNTKLIAALKNTTQLIVAGEALSHCVAYTVRDLAKYIDAKNITLLSDCTSSVNGFKTEGQNFIDEMCAQGMRVSSSAEIF